MMRVLDNIVYTHFLKLRVTNYFVLFLFFNNNSVDGLFFLRCFFFLLYFLVFGVCPKDW